MGEGIYQVRTVRGQHHQVASSIQLSVAWVLVSPLLHQPENKQWAPLHSWAIQFPECLLAKS